MSGSAVILSTRHPLYEATSVAEAGALTGYLFFIHTASGYKKPTFFRVGVSVD